MRIFKRSDSKVYYLDYTDAQGNRVKESTGTTSKKLAEEILAKRKTDIIEGKFGIEKPKKLTFNEVLVYRSLNNISILAKTLRSGPSYISSEIQPVLC